MELFIIIIVIISIIIIVVVVVIVVYDHHHYTLFDKKVSQVTVKEMSDWTYYRQKSSM